MGRRLQLGLGALWLLDAGLQYQPFMFTRAFVTVEIEPASGGLPAFLAGPITGSAHLLAQHIFLFNFVFASVQLLIAICFFSRHYLKPAIVASVLWTVMVWWLGEGLGGLVQAASPLAGAPGAVIIYALVAIGLWPREPRSPTSGVGTSPASSGRFATYPGKLVWMLLWGGFAGLLLTATNRAPSSMAQIFSAAGSGQATWIKTMERFAVALVGRRGTELSIGLAIVCLATAGSVLGRRSLRPAVIVAMVLGGVFWVAEGFGGIFTGQGTDPNSGPLLVLLGACYWPYQKIAQSEVISNSSSQRSGGRREIMALLDRLPRGAKLSLESAAARHRINTWLLLLHLPVLALVGLLGPRPSWEIGLVLIPSGFAVCSEVARVRAGDNMPTGAHDLTSVGLLSCTFVLIELTGGLQEAHFHIFVMLPFVALYQSWRPLAAAIVATLVDHLVLGILLPMRVFGMDVHGLSLLWMLMYHVGMVVLEVIAILCWWHFAELAEAEGTAVAERASKRQDADHWARQAGADQQVAVDRVRREELAGIGMLLIADADRIRESASESNRSVEGVDLQLESLSAVIQQIAEQTNRAGQTAAAGQGSAEEAGERVRRLEKSIAEISTVNSMISQLAAQTRLLSLNATIEAARAGEMGRGFTVVANEVKQLASETASAAEKVKEVIATVVSEAAAVAESFATTSSVVTEIHGIQTDIAASVEEQAMAIRQVSSGLAAAAGATRAILGSLDALTTTAAGLS